MTRRRLLLLLPLLAAVALGVFYGARARHGAAASRWALASVTGHDVAVDLWLSRDSAGQLWVQGEFTPTRRGFHLYGKDLPAQGLSGIGRPTRLEVVSGGMRAAGPLQADRAPQDLRVDVLGLTFPVYPPGPVVLRRPVALTGHGDTAVLSLTYMACTEGTCLAPAVDRHVSVTLPGALRR